MLSGKIQVFVYLFTFFDFHSEVHQNGKIRKKANSLFLLFSTKPGLLVGIRWSIYNSKSSWISWVFFAWTDSGLFIYHLVVESNFNFLSNSYPVVSGYVLLLCLFAASAYNVIYRFTLSTFAVLLNIISFRLNIICPYGIIFCSY